MLSRYVVTLLIRLAYKMLLALNLQPDYGPFHGLWTAFLVADVVWGSLLQSDAPARLCCSVRVRPLWISCAAVGLFKPESGRCSVYFSMSSWVDPRRRTMGHGTFPTFTGCASIATNDLTIIPAGSRSRDASPLWSIRSLPSCSNNYALTVGCRDTRSHKPPRGKLLCKACLS